MPSAASTKEINHFTTKLPSNRGTDDDVTEFMEFTREGRSSRCVIGTVSHQRSHLGQDATNEPKQINMGSVSVHVRSVYIYIYITLHTFLYMLGPAQVLQHWIFGQLIP